MKTTLLKNSAIAICLFASLFLVGAIQAADTEPDTENCWYAGIIVHCDAYYSYDCGDGTYDISCKHLVLGNSVGWNTGGGPSIESCNDALHALMVDAAYAGCLIQEGSPHCYEGSGACKVAEPLEPAES